MSLHTCACNKRRPCVAFVRMSVSTTRFLYARLSPYQRSVLDSPCHNRIEKLNVLADFVFFFTLCSLICCGGFGCYTSFLASVDVFAVETLQRFDGLLVKNEICCDI